MQKEHYLPASIVVGCALIGLGMYLGLRERAAPTPLPPASQPSGHAAGHGATSQSLSPQGPSPQAPSPQQASPQSPTPAATADQAAAEKAALAALASVKKDTLTPRCWEPALKKAPEPAKAKFKLDVSFDAQGKQIMSGLHELREAPRLDVAACLRENPITLSIPAPGAVVRLELPLDFP